jgi:isopentenyl-diphosphate delta-isomerase
VSEELVLVDENDNEVGRAGKLEAHEKGLLHRAFSVVLFQKENPGLTLLQQRAAVKYHCPLMWANACCSHPRPGETPIKAALRRVPEELAIPSPPLAFAGSFLYRAPVGKFIEHEFDHVFYGFLSKDTPIPMVAEQVAAVEWADVQRLTASAARSYVPWLEKAVEVALAASNRKISA